MTSTAAPPIRPISTRVAWLLGTPALVSIALGSAVVVASRASGQAIDVGWTLLVLLGPSIPIYLLLLPLFPFVLRALRRGWDPSPALVLATTLGVSAAVDLAFWLGSTRAG